MKNPDEQGTHIPPNKDSELLHREIERLSLLVREIQEGLSKSMETKIEVESVIHDLERRLRDAQKELAKVRETFRRREGIEGLGFDAFITAELQNKYPGIDIRVVHDEADFRHLSKQTGGSWTENGIGLTTEYYNRFYLVRDDGTFIPEMDPSIYRRLTDIFH